MTKYKANNRSVVDLADRNSEGGSSIADEPITSLKVSQKAIQMKSEKKKAVEIPEKEKDSKGREKKAY